MTERDHVIQFLFKKIDEMKKEHVADLMRAKRLDELNTIAEKLDTIGYMKDLERLKVGEFDIKNSITIEELEKIDLSVLNYFVKSYYLDLPLEGLPEDSLLEMVFIINQTSFSDEDILLDWNVFRDALAKTGKNFECQIAELMDDWNIGYLTLEQLLTGKVEDCDKDD